MAYVFRIYWAHNRAPQLTGSPQNPEVVSTVVLSTISLLLVWLGAALTTAARSSGSNSSSSSSVTGVSDVVFSKIGAGSFAGASSTGDEGAATGDGGVATGDG